MTDEASKDVLLYRAPNGIEAALLVAMLEESGVRAKTVGGEAAVGFGELGADALMVDIHVSSADSQRGVELINAHYASKSDPEPWTCAKCGESLEVTFASCWKCGASRS